VTTTAEKPQVEALFRRIVKEEVAPVYELLGQLLDGVTATLEGQRRLEAELIFRRQLDDRRSRFDEKWFDTARVVDVLGPLRPTCSATDPRYVSRTFSAFRKGNPAQTKGSTLAKLIRAMGLDPVDVDDDLEAAEVTR
jgi:hypothetical protein